jgi:hypothetical protein
LSRQARVALALCAGTLGMLSAAAWGAAQPATPSPGATPAPDPQVLMEGLPTKMGRRIVSQLRTTHSAMPTVLRTTHVTQPDGGEHVFFVYEYSLFDACVAAAPSRAEGRQACRDRLQEDARCTTAKAAFVTVAGTPAGRTAGTGGAINVVFDVDVRRGCRTHRVLEVAMRDVDADQRPELLVDIVGTRPERGFRSGDEYERRLRDLLILDATGREQLHAELGAWGPINDESATSSVAARWSMRDTNADRRPDVVVESFEYEEMYDCPVTDDGWFTPSSEDEYECSGALRRTTFRYDTARDVFVE